MLRSETRRFFSFDGQITARTACYRPERYAELEADLGGKCRIARGGGYAYAAASFGDDIAVQDMRRFNRILRFDPERRVLDAESGLTLGDLLHFIVPRGFRLPVAPGYPGITLGGCLAANVHGKNPFKHGVFADYVDEFLLFHPDHGRRRVSRESDLGLFALACGSLGLTGIIESMSLRLEPCEGEAFAVDRLPVRTFTEALDLLYERAGQSEHAYSFHDPTPSRKSGRGYVTLAAIAGRADVSGSSAKSRETIVTAESRRRLSFSVWGGRRSHVINGAYWRAVASRAVSQVRPWFPVEFPFAASPGYFLLFGTRGLFEFQAIVPRDATADFLSALERSLKKSRPDAVLCSLKLFRGTGRYLCFARDGVCFTMDFAASRTSRRFLEELDALCLDHGGIPNISKDSRLPRAVAAAAYPEFEAFRAALCAFDPHRRFQSELSRRLGL